MKSDSPVTNISEFLERIRNIRKKWEVKDHEELWFRGEQEKYDTFLVPKIYRGLNIKEKPDQDFFLKEYDLYDEFQRLCDKFIKGEISEENYDWDSYILMQNHNAPTRLLDWTDGALIAVHFAIRDKLTNTNESKNPIIYILNPDNDVLREKTDESKEIEKVKEDWKQFVQKQKGRGLNDEWWEEAYIPFDEEDLEEIDIPYPPLLLRSPHITSRLGSQRSRMIFFGKDPWWFQENGDESFLQEIEIDWGSCKQIMIELRDCGITESVIFPDLDGLGKEMDQFWKVLFDDYRKKS
ncbi:FRG domain-containing protein [Methylacidiphilum caldifontis]|uniref:FRG domain-containing protein n=1 Tax=Methylacidiphilum caldifontis TaxID=2795386 RepID=A0A4Y8P9V7_9BACT|nr:FRG domain-containing protein [Methylacidiphilum caldifontis]TFE67120.1 hypothetical protein A7Q10_09880 [Methylacidiphilum caldifontis]